MSANFHEGDAPQILGAETTLLAGAGSAPDALGRSVHVATFGSFVQAHRGQAARVHAILAEALGLVDAPPSRAVPSSKAPRVLDLYGGSGAIALGLASAGARVHLVESFAPAVSHARTAAESQGLTVTGECGDVATALKSLLERGERFDAAVVNPPRRGMSPMAREWIARLEPPVLAYVSCDPDTLARDLDHFVRLGYQTSELRPLDMIPLTDEVETVAVLRRASAPTPRVVYEDDQVLVVEKGPHEPTMPQGEYASSLLARARRIPGAGDAIPVHRIDVGTSGLVVLARTPEVAPRWVDALAGPNARKIYVAGARGVTPSKGAITRELREEGRMFPARTRYRRLAVASGHSVLRVIPEQGRTHHIRRHLAAIGHPVLGDDRYGHVPTNRFFEEKNGLDRAFLHCVRIEVDHPGTGARLLVEAPLPGDSPRRARADERPGDAALPRSQERARHERHASRPSRRRPIRSTSAGASSTSTRAHRRFTRRRPATTTTWGRRRRAASRRSGDRFARERDDELRLVEPSDRLARVPAHARVAEGIGAREEAAPGRAALAVREAREPRALEQVTADARGADVARVVVERAGAEAKRAARGVARRCAPRGSPAQSPRRSSRRSPPLRRRARADRSRASSRARTAAC